MSDFTPTERTKLHRLPKRGNYDRETVNRILDEGLFCHVGFVAAAQPYVIPTGYGRVDDTLYLHGSAASRMLGELGKGIPVCVTVMLMDGLVLARSAFHHSVNYRSVMILGSAREVTSEDEKWKALEAFTNHMVPGRWKDVREPTPQEMKATTVLALALEEVSAKVRTGPPIDDEEDYGMPVWAGVIPLSLTASAPVSDPRLTAPIAPPEYARHYRRK
ncbi:MAG TPA: pyridoxamine 5'-phosphate oxidase family protein [Candidatus Acidoferrales bacterium]|jgi:nitroimidazol reductase NimA-like FMN-containing flavoprotein (pyridoxamine 5'-phosphate oxidase superfamily)|nr:pyridoxamine 5'-phosphate oxidase family protein [Candidatus Acidoferrales bacterium]